MCSDGTVVGRKFLRLPAEYDCLNHRINRIKQAQQRGARRTPRLWGYADNVNRHIAELTARFISDIAMEYNADCVVFEALELKGKKRGSKKQRLHLWRARSVQSIVTGKVHRFGCRVSPKVKSSLCSRRIRTILFIREFRSDVSLRYVLRMTRCGFVQMVSLSRSH